MPLWFHACEHQLHEGHGKDLSSTGVVDAPKATNIGQVNLISLPPKGLFSTGKQSYVFFLVGPFVYTFASQASEDTGTCSPAPTNPATTTETILLYLRPCRGSVSSYINLSQTWQKHQWHFKGSGTQKVLVQYSVSVARTTCITIPNAILGTP